jgi:recombinase
MAAPRVVAASNDRLGNSGGSTRKRKAFLSLLERIKMERRMTGAKTRAAKRHAIAQGLMVGPIPLGFTRSLEHDPVWSPVVRRIFDEYATGKHSTMSLARKFNAEGLNPPGWKSGFRSDSLSQLLRHRGEAGPGPTSEAALDWSRH